MPDSTYVAPILLNGSMVAALISEPVNQGNPGDANYGIVMPQATALGAVSETYRLVWYQNVNTVDTQFGNGQFWRLEVYNAALDPDGDPSTGNDGWTTVPGYDQLTPKHDLVNGLGDGDEYIVFSTSGGSHLLYDINGGLPTTPTTLVYLATDENGDPIVGDNDGHLDFYDAYAAFCFVAGTMIETPTGPVRVEALRIGDLVLTQDDGAVPLRWIGHRVLTARELSAAPQLSPISISKGALGKGIPEVDLLVSPQHRILVRSRVARRMFGEDEVLVAAKHLLGLDGIVQLHDQPSVHYVHIAFDHHQLVFANGAQAESFHAGAEGLKALGAEARAEFLALFPELVTSPDGYDRARPFVSGRRGRQMAARHAKNHVALFS